MRAELGVPDRLTIRLEGVFDLPAAQQLVRTLAQANGCEVHVDLEHVREFHDLAVVQLARSIADRRGTSVSGLRQHHLRLLRYLGVDGAWLEEPSGLA